MATTKKAAPKKATPSKSKSTAAKKTVASKAVASRTVKKAAPKKKVATSKRARAKELAMRSFRIYEEQSEFMSTRITRQTFYWLVLAIFLIFVQLWILKLQLDVITIIDAQQAQIQNI